VTIFVNERPVPYRTGMTAGQVRDEHRPAADIIIVNGGVVEAERPLAAGDRLVLIARGAAPSRDELEKLMVARHSPGVHDRVKRATVGIAGAGGLGSTVAVTLARLGVGTLVLADDDIVEPSNLNRQQFFVDQIGAPKVEALAETLARVNPYTAVETHAVKLTRENMPRIFGACEVVVECFDDPDAKAMALACARTALSGIAWVMASGLAGYGPSNALHVRQLFPNVFVAGDGAAAAGPGSGLMAPRVTICAGIQANAVLRLLLGLPVVDSHEREAPVCA
jgi:sulfur carrier protein ThiS adenylyltransferase